MCLKWIKNTSTNVHVVIYHFQRISVRTQGFPGDASGKEPTCKCRLEITDTDSMTGLGRAPWGGHGNSVQCSPVCPGESHGQRSLEGCSP